MSNVYLAVSFPELSCSHAASISASDIIEHETLGKNLVLCGLLLPSDGTG
jgi:hypothetical protein